MALPGKLLSPPSYCKGASVFVVTFRGETDFTRSKILSLRTLLLTTVGRMLYNTHGLLFSEKQTVKS